MNWETYSLLGVGAGLTALTLTRSTLTQKLRTRLIKIPVIGELVNCPYCMCHWTGAVFATSWLPEGIGSYLIDACITTGFAVLFTGVMMKLWLFQEAELDRYRAAIKEMVAKPKEINHEAEPD